MVQLRIGTRGSALALVQARAVAALLLERAGVRAEIVVIATSGDRLADRSLSDAGGKGRFTKEIEDALLGGTIDLAVHSSKDVPAHLPPGLDLTAALPREDPSDALVLRSGVVPAPFDAMIRALGASPLIGTGSSRRVAQLSPVVPAARFQPIRGNVDTRVRKLDDGQFDALVLAAAGLRRLGLHSRISSLIPLEVCIPSPGQGTIVIETRADDDATRAVVRAVNDGDAMTCLVAERAVVSRLGGECQMPIGATASVERGILTLRCIVAAPDGSRAARSQVQGPATLAQDLGVEAAVHLLAAGGDQILQALRERRDRT